MRGTLTLGTMLLAMLGISGPDPAPAQGAVRIVSREVTPGSVRTGDPFTLSTTLRLPPRLKVYIPDSLPSAVGIQTRGPVKWSAQTVAGDSLELDLSYPLLAVRPGEVRLPTLLLALVPAPSADAADPAAARVALGSQLSEGERFRRYAVQMGSALVAPLLQAGDSLAAFAPRAPADVLGRNWSPWVIATVALALLAFLLQAGRWLWSRARHRDLRALVRRVTSPSPRRAALRELEQIRGLGLHTNGRIDEFYARTTDVARQFTRRREPELGAALTSSEWIARLAERHRNGSLEDLTRVVEIAELVKFGRHHPDPSSAEGDWAAVRDWIRTLR